MKAQFYIDKAINIDDENINYWLLHSKVNTILNNYEEAEKGYKKLLDLGDMSIDTWVQRGDILIKLGKLKAAKNNLIEAKKYHSKNEELEFRLAGIYFELKEPESGFIHLLHGLHINAEHVFIIEELFPKIYKSQKVVKFISSYKNSSN